MHMYIIVYAYIYIYIIHVEKYTYVYTHMYDIVYMILYDFHQILSLNDLGKTTLFSLRGSSSHFIRLSGAPVAFVVPNKRRERDGRGKG